MNVALCPHAAKYILHKMGLATCWLAIYADDERWLEVFHRIYIQVFEDHVVVQLTEGREFKCDREDLHIVEDHVWHLNAKAFVTTCIDGHNILFQNIVINHMPNKRNTVYHIN